MTRPIYIGHHTEAEPEPIGTLGDLIGDALKKVKVENAEPVDTGSVDRRDDE